MPESASSAAPAGDGRRLRYAGRREELLQAATAYVLENGAGAIAMRPLAQAVGVSHSALIHHFGSKEELLSEVIELLRHESMPTELAELATADPDGIDPTQTLRTWWTTRTAPEQLPLFRLTLEVFAEAVLHPVRNRRFLDHFVDDWLTAFERIVARVGCPVDEAPLMATLVLAQVRGLILDLLATGDRERVDRSFELFVAENRARMRRWRGAQPAEPQPPAGV